MLSEEANDKSVNFAMRLGKLTGREIYKTFEKILANRKNKQISTVKQGDKVRAGRTTMKQLQKKHDGLNSVELKSPDLRMLNSFMKKHGVRFACVKDGQNKYTMFFKAKDIDSVNNAFQQYARKFLRLNNTGPSIRRNLVAARELANTLTNDRAAERNRNRGGLEL